MKLEDLFDRKIQKLKRRMEVGDSLNSIFMSMGLEAVKEETGAKAGFPYIAQVNTYLYYSEDHMFMSKVDADSNKVLETKHIDFIED